MNKKKKKCNQSLLLILTLDVTSFTKSQLLTADRAIHTRHNLQLKMLDGGQPEQNVFWKLNKFKLKNHKNVPWNFEKTVRHDSMATKICLTHCNIDQK